MGTSRSRQNEIRIGAPKVSISVIRKVEPSICKIIYQENNKIEKGTGFFMWVNGNKCLITNYHVIDKEKNNKTITIEKFNNKKAEIKLNDKYINYFDKLDITIININDNEDIIKDIKFLYYDLNFKLGYNQYINNEVFALQFPKDNTELASGKIIEILDDFEFGHNIDTEKGSSGSPIILINTSKVIGIHTQGDKENNSNYGTFIGEIFKNNNLNINNSILSNQNEEEEEHDRKINYIEKNNEEKEREHIKKFQKIINQSIVKIEMEIEIEFDEYKYILGIGFLCDIKFKNMKALITYSNIIDEEFLDNQEELIFYIGEEKNEINLNKDRYKEAYEDINITIIEIIDEDNINNDNFIEIDDFVRSKNYNDEEIIYINFNKNNKHAYQNDKIINKNNYYTMQSIVRINEGIILLNNNLKIIGITYNNIILMKELIKKIKIIQRNIYIKIENRENQNRDNRNITNNRDNRNNKDNKDNIDNISDKQKKKVIWIDPIFIKKKTYLRLRELKKDKRLILKKYGKINIAFNYLKYVKFDKTIIVIKGELYIEFIKQFNKNIRDIDVIPKIIIFARNKNDYLGENIEYKKYSENSFYNLGGIKNSIDDINDFIFKTPHIENVIKLNSKLYYNEDNNLLEYLNIWNKMDQMNDFNFGYLDSFEIYPLIFKLLNAIKMDNMDKYTELLYSKYSNDNKYVKDLLEPIINIRNIPIELLSKYYIRLYTIESNFYRDINKELRENNIMYYLPYIKILYEGIKLRELKLPSNSFLYGCGVLSVKEIDKIKKYLEEKPRKDQQKIIILKSFFSFTKEREIAEKFFDNKIKERSDLKNVFYVLEIDDNENYDLLTYADIDNISYFANEKEVLFFPFSSFEIIEIRQTIINKEDNYEIKLLYLGRHL